MTESEHVQKDIGAIRTRLDQIESMQRLIVASNKDVREHVRAVLSERENAADVITLLSGGSMLQEDIMSALAKSQGTISKVLTYLYDAGLLVKYPDSQNSRKDRWGLNDLETTVNIVKVAKEIVASRAKAPDRRGPSGATEIPPR